MRSITAGSLLAADIGCVKKLAAVLLSVWFASSVQAAVSATKSVEVDAIGVHVTYVIEAANDAGVPASAFVVDNVPATLTNVSATILAGGGAVSIDHLTNNLWWTGVSIPANGVARLRIEGSVRSGAPAGTVITNVATVQYDSDGNGSEDTAVATNAASFTVASRAVSASLAKVQLSPDPVTAGSGAGNLVYRVTVTASSTNERAAWFTIAEVPDVAPGVTLDGAATANGTWDPASRHWTTGWLVPGESATLDVTMTAGAAAPSTITNTAAFVTGAFDFVPTSPASVSSAITPAPAEVTGAIPALDPVALAFFAAILAFVAVRVAGR